MTQNQSFSEDHNSPAGDSTDRERLAATEQRLRNARPRPVELDIEAIVRAARPADQPVLLPDGNASGHSTRSYAWFGAIAGAWACGAIAGALLTFLLLNQAASPDGTQSESIIAQQRQPRDGERTSNNLVSDETSVEPRNESPADDTGPRSDDESLDSATMSASYTQEATAYENRRSILRAREFDRLQASPDALYGLDFSPAIELDRVGISDGKNNARHEWMSGSVPDAPVTRKRLLQELLGAGSESLL